VEVGSARADNVSRSMDTGLLVTTLELVALEQLTEVRQTTVRELHSEQFPVLNEFEALYAWLVRTLPGNVSRLCRRGA